MKRRTYYHTEADRVITTSGDGSAGAGLNALAWRQNVAAGIAIEVGNIGDIAANIHYPECWDTMAYPTLASAVCEITMCAPMQCNKVVGGEE